MKTDGIAPTPEPERKKRAKEDSDILMKRALTGVGVALVTPFTRDGKVDFAGLGRLVDYVIENGVDYIVSLGTTAETVTLDRTERDAVAAFIVEHNAGRVPLVAGCGGNCTAEVVRMLDGSDLSAFSAILSVTPYYNRPSQRGLYEHYKVIAAESPVPVILYNVPSRTGVNMTAETTLRIAREIPNVIGIKEACGKFEQMEELLAGRPEGFRVISGDDSMALGLVRRGGDGVISVAANVFPRDFTRCVKLAFEGRHAEAETLYTHLSEAIHALFEEGNPTGVKSALAVKGMIEPVLRLPLVEGSPALMEKFKKLVVKYEL